MTSGDERQSQFLRGSLDMCLLALLAEQPSHVYALTDRLAAAGLEGIVYGTLYPLVTRLRLSGLLVEQTEPSSAGPPRKVFSPSPAGHAALQQWAAEWFSRTEAVRTLLLQTGVLPTSTTIKEFS